MDNYIRSYKIDENGHEYEEVKKIENKVNNIKILDKDPFILESCKNIYRALLIVAANEIPHINNISDVLNNIWSYCKNLKGLIKKNIMEI